MPNHYRGFLSGTAYCALIAGYLLLPGPASAQSASESGAGNAQGLEEVVVTARKRSESAQKTPIAISAFTSDQLEKQQITKVQDLQNSVPGLFVQSTSSDQFNALISLRGIATQNIAQDLDPGVAVYVDGQYQGFSGANLSDPYDVQRIEVLKGPQGTLFGRNSTGGAVSVVHNLPTDEFEGWVKGGFGDYDQHSGAALINIPIVDQMVEFRGFGGYNERGGFGHDTGPFHNGTPYGDLQSYQGFATLRLAPTDDLEILLRGSTEHSRSNGIANHLTYCEGGCAAEAAIDQGFPLTAAGLAAASAQAIANSNSSFYDGAQNLANSDSARKQTGSLTINYTINDDLSVKSITSYLHATRLLDADGDGTILPIAESHQDTSENQITQEVTLNGTAIDKKLKYSAGVYYYSKTAKDEQAGYFLADFGGTGGLYQARNNTESVAPYAQATYALTSNLNFTAGLRWTTEQKSISERTFAVSNSLSNIIGCIAASPANNCFTSADASFHSTSYLYELDYTPIPDVMIYAKTSRGFRSGGVQETAPGFPNFAPEQLTDYEVGEKAELFDRKVRINFDLYHSDYDNLQQNVYRYANNSINSLIANAGTAQVEGAELQGAVQPIEHLTLSTQAAYTYPHYLTFVDALQGQLKGQRFPNVARWSYGLGADYTLPLDLGPLNFHVDWHWQSDTVTAAVPTLASIANGANVVEGVTGQTSYGILNGRVSFKWEEQGLDIALWGRNLTDKHYYTYVQDFTGNPGAPSVGFVSSNVGNPRTFGVEFTYNFGPSYQSPPTTTNTAVAPPPPVAPPAPPPAPAPEPQRSFQVFFDFDKSNITPDAARVIEAAANAVKSGHVAQLDVVGHTDTVGSARYNQKLSVRRAASVKAELVKDGLSASEIATSGVGKTDLLVPTPDGVREPQNRRAEIRLGAQSAS